jgi:predicted nuclease of predicted toxin-antitoxin system
MMWSSHVNSGQTLETGHYSTGRPKKNRILVTIDTDFGELIYLENLSHAGLVRLPDVPARERQLILQDLLTRYETELQNAAIMTVRGGRIRISKGPKQN